MKAVSSLSLVCLLLFSTFGVALLPAATADTAPASADSSSTPAPQSAPTPNLNPTRPIVLLLNAEAHKPNPRSPNPYFLAFDQISYQMPGGWAGIVQGGPDAASVFKYPGTANSFQHVTSTYDSSMPTWLNITLNSANETGKIFNFEIDIDLDNDGVNDTFISFPSYTTDTLLEPISLNYQPTSFTFADPQKTAMNDAKIYLRVWRTDTVAENPFALARIYTGYLYESSITLPWVNPAPTAVIAKPDGTEQYWTSIPITFSAFGTFDPYYNLLNLTARWDFGDNSTPKFSGAESNQTHIYRAEGWYNITLTIQNTLGFSDDATTEIFVKYRNVPPTVSATAVEGKNIYIGSFAGFQGVPYNFSAVYDDVDNGKENVSVTWDFGDGGMNYTGNATHIFNSTGNFTVTASASDGNDTVSSSMFVNISKNRPPLLAISVPSRVNKGSVVTVSAVGTTDPDGLPIKGYRWNFGDTFCTENNTCEANTVVATHHYDVGGTYRVTLQAFDGIETSTTTADIKVNQQPLAVCPAPKSLETSRETSFDGQLSRDPDLDPLVFRWKFGDGVDTEYSASSTASHIYSVPKPEGYTAQLIVSDSLWTHSCTFLVRVDLINEPPVANIWCSATVVWLGDSFRCSANQSVDEFELTYLWDFDASDGVSLSDDFRKDIQITYQAPGQYTISLQVKDNKGKTSDATVNVEVKENPGFCNQIYDMSNFLRKTTASPAGADHGEFETGVTVGAGNVTAVKKGCFAGYSVDVKAGDDFTIWITVKSTLEGKIVDVYAFDTPNFIVYQDKNPATLPPIDSSCLKPKLTAAGGTLECKFTPKRTGTVYVVIDNKDRPGGEGLAQSEGPVEFGVKAVMPWKVEGPIDPKLVPFLVGGAGAAVALVGVIFWLTRRQEKSY